MLSSVKIYSKKLNTLQDLLSSVNAVISTIESTRIITGHVIYNPAYTYKFQLKTTKKDKTLKGQRTKDQGAISELFDYYSMTFCFKK